jgi:hypothetical protein
MFQKMPLMMTKRRTATTTEPSVKSSDPDFLMLANAKHEIKFHGTVPFWTADHQTSPSGSPIMLLLPT